MARFKEVLAGWFSFGIDTGNKYRTLAVVKGMMKVLAWVFLVFGIIMALVVLIIGGDPETPRSTSIFVFFFAVIEFMFLYALAEVLAMLVNIEGNTAKTAKLLGAREEK